MPDDSPMFLGSLGARVLPHNPAELAHRFAGTAAGQQARTADPTKLRSLLPYLPGVRNQGQFGACTGFTAAELAYICARILGLSPVDLSPLFDYFETRTKEGSYPQDAGAAMSDALDVALTGLPPETDMPYSEGIATAPSAQALADAAQHQYLASHHPIYTTDPGGFVGGMLAALDALQPVSLVMAWDTAFDVPSPTGVLPRQPSGQIRGYHAISGIGSLPSTADRPLLVAALNHWGPYTPAAGTILPGAPAGVFYIPADHFQNGIVTEVRAVAAKPQPKPVPDPLAPLWQWLQADAFPYLDQHRDAAELAVLRDTLDAWLPRSGKLGAAAGRRLAALLRK